MDRDYDDDMSKFEIIDDQWLENQKCVASRTGKEIEKQNDIRYSFNHEKSISIDNNLPRMSKHNKRELPIIEGFMDEDDNDTHNSDDVNDGDSKNIHSDIII